MARWSPRLVLVLALVGSMLGTSTTAHSASLLVERLAGLDRYETAVEISEAAWGPGTQIAFVATGLNFADSVAVAAAGGDLGPVLLTRPDVLPEVTAAELRRLDPEVVVVLGGPLAISDDVQLQIVRAMPGTGVTVTRLAGADRYETAVAIAQELRPEPNIVYLADGGDYADSIIAAASAGIEGGVLLTTAQSVLVDSVANELARISPETLVAVGDLDPRVVDAASVFATNTFWEQGSSDEDLSVRLSEILWESATDVLMASSADFPDALASAALSVSASLPMLLTDPGALQPRTACELLRLGTEQIFLAGGPNAVSSAVERQLTDIKPRDYGCKDPLAIEIPDPLPSTPEVEVTLYELTTSPDSKTAYVVNNAWNSVEVIDLVDGEWLGRIAVGSNPVDIDITPDGNRLYVVNNGSQTISVIDTKLPFDRAEIAQVQLLDAGPNALRSFSIEVADNNRAYIIPAQLEASVEGCLQVLRPNLTIDYLNPGTDPDIPYGAFQGFHSADHKLIGMISGERPVDENGDAPEIIVIEEDGEPVYCGPPLDEEEEEEEEEGDGETTGETPGDTASSDRFLFTLEGGTWSSVGAFGRVVAEVAYGNVDENGITSDGGGTATVFEASSSSPGVLGTITSAADTTYGLAVAPLQPNCPKNRGNPAVCTQLAYNVVAGEQGSVDVLDMTVGRNVGGSYRVIDTIPLASAVGAYGGKNQPVDSAIINQAVVSADATSLVVATEFTVEILPIG